MARPERRDADYFPFYAKDGKTLFILEEKYGCKGTGFFTNVMRFLTLQEDHHFCIKEDADRLYFFAKTKCDEESGLDMLDIMSKTCKLNTALWVSYKVIVCETLLQSLEDAYRNRKNDIITIDEIKQKYVSYDEKPQESGVSYVENPQGCDVSYIENPQSKVKKSKVNKKEINDELIEALKKEYPHLDIDFELDKYKHYQDEKPRSKKHADRKRGFRNWVKQAEKWRGERASPNKSSSVSIDEILERRNNGETI